MFKIWFPLLSMFLIACSLQKLAECQMSYRQRNSARAHVITELSKVAPGQYAHQVSIRTSAEYQHLCAGTLIALKFVMTSAVCVFHEDGSRYRPIDLTVIAGHVALDEEEDVGQLGIVAKIFVHRNYGKNFNDQPAILMLKKALVPSDELQAIGIKDSTVVSYQICGQVGWNLDGSCKVSGASSDDLIYRISAVKRVKICRSLLGDCLSFFSQEVGCWRPGAAMVCDNQLAGLFSHIEFPNYFFTDLFENGYAKWAMDIITQDYSKLLHRAEEPHYCETTCKTSNNKGKTKSFAGKSKPDKTEDKPIKDLKNELDMSDVNDLIHRRNITCPIVKINNNPIINEIYVNEDCDPATGCDV